MSDLITFMRDTEPWISVVSATKYGSPLRDRALLDVLSPLRLAGDIRAPLLVVHGRNDFNVPLAESERIVDALRQRGGDVTFRVFEDEGHELHLLGEQAGVRWGDGRLAVRPTRRRRALPDGNSGRLAHIGQRAALTRSRETAADVPRSTRPSLNPLVVQEARRSVPPLSCTSCAICNRRRVDPRDPVLTEPEGRVGEAEAARGVRKR